MTEQPMTPGRQYIIKHGTRSVSGSISTIQYRIDVNTLKHLQADNLELNEIGSCTVSVNAPIVFDPYKKSKTTGSFIIIDRLTNVTIGAGMISGISDSTSFNQVSAAQRMARFSQKATSIALSGANNINASYQLERKLFDTGHAATILETTEDTILTSIKAIKHAGLICICPNITSEPCDLQFDTDNLSVEQIYAALKEQEVIL